MQLDIKDRKILAYIETHARASCQEIGKNARLLKETVAYRIKRLEQNGIIQKYITLINFSQLGYTGYAIYCRFVGIDERKKQEILAYLSDIPQLYWIALIGGKYDLVYAVICKSVFEFNKVYYQILTKYGKYLDYNTIAIRSELHQYERGYILDKKIKESKAPFFGKEPTAEVLDSLDEDIISVLSNNARMPVVELAAILKKPASTITQRMQQLKKRQIIQCYWTYIRAQNYGMQSYRLLLYLQNMDQQARARIFSYVHANPHMLLAIEVVGQWNFEITIEVSDQTQLQAEIILLRDTFKDIIRNVDFIIMFEDNLIYDPYPLKKLQRSKLLHAKSL